MMLLLLKVIVVVIVVWVVLVVIVVVAIEDDRLLAKGAAVEVDLRVPELLQADVHGGGVVDAVQHLKLKEA